MTFIIYELEFKNIFIARTLYNISRIIRCNSVCSLVVGGKISNCIYICIYAPLLMTTSHDQEEVKHSPSS